MSETGETPTITGKGTGKDPARRPQPRPFATRARLAIWLAAILAPWLLLLLVLRLLASVLG